METKSNLEAALHYIELGFSVIPIGQDKIPLIKWQKYEKERASKEQVEQWFTQFSEANIGVVTGEISGIVVVDVEAGGKTENLPPTVISKTGGGGWHFFYKHPGQPIKNAIRIMDKTDIRGDGGYVVMPPSLHKSGNRYEWAMPPEDADFAELPIWILKGMESPDLKKVDWQEFLNTDNFQGTRNASATQLAGKLFYHLPVELWEITGWATLKEWNLKNNKPPLDEVELRSTWESIKKAELSKRTAIGKRETEKPGRKSQSTVLLEIIESDRVDLFHNELKEPYACLTIGNHQEMWPCRSKAFKRWLAKVFWDTQGSAINSDALNTAIGVVEGKACFEGKECALANRVVFFENAIWYDLADSNWQAVKVTADGWQLIERPPVLFRRYAHQQSQPQPVSNGDAKKLLKFVNLKDDSQKLLLLTVVISYFIPGFPHPVLTIHGAQGSAKSVLCKLIKKLIDPSAVDASDIPRDSSGLAQLLAHHWCIFFDNLSNLPDWVSDNLCKAVSGGGFSKRELYSDDDDIIYTIKRCIGINGINLVATKPDLLERSIILELERIPDNKRKQEQQLWEEFEEARSGILGGIFDVVAKAMKTVGSIELSNLPRMADFTKWGCAIAEALGHTKEDFLDAYYGNIKGQNEEVLGSSLVATVVRQFIGEKLEWEGTPSQLLTELTNTAKDQGINTDKERSWPKAANALSKRLNELKTNLDVDGIQFSKGEKDKKRFISLRFQQEDKNTVSIETPEAATEYNNNSGYGNDGSKDAASLSPPASSPEIPPDFKDNNDSDDSDDLAQQVSGLFD